MFRFIIDDALKHKESILRYVILHPHFIRYRTTVAYFSPLWTFEERDFSSDLIRCNRFAIVEWLQALLAAIPAEAGSRKLFILILTLPLPELSAQSNGADLFHVCILFSSPVMETLYLTASILFDSIVFIITIQRDGTLYFGIILTGNAIWMIFALCGRPGLKLMNAQFTSVMISRLTLSLRRTSYERYSAWSFKTFELSDTLADNEPLRAGIS
ncbi:hypothetical protein IW261DRAFT_1503341 [Armillaria novae-zelandiae]|uniref:Uncharacterized protein n=1 Tax=Armillaria novae-zelandiae TaxID=153914 RepID=A0AA39NXN1_9AGAR|nr:hypothetical protein IW261DRAFT_1503341 [Armillaria novae-zelandiae]